MFEASSSKALTVGIQCPIVEAPRLAAKVALGKIFAEADIFD